MEISRKRLNRAKQQILNITDLPEQIFRKLFRYLELITIYFTLRSICQKFMGVVDAYVALGGTFIPASRREFPTQILHVFKRDDRSTTIVSRLTNSFQYPTYAGIQIEIKLKSVYFKRD